MTVDDLTKAKALATQLPARYPADPFAALMEFRRAVRGAGRMDVDHVASMAAKVLIIRGAPGANGYREPAVSG